MKLKQTLDLRKKPTVLWHHSPLVEGTVWISLMFFIAVFIVVIVPLVSQGEQTCTIDYHNGNKVCDIGR